MKKVSFRTGHYVIMTIALVLANLFMLFVLLGTPKSMEHDQGESIAANTTAPSLDTTTIEANTTSATLLENVVSKPVDLSAKATVTFAGDFMLHEGPMYAGRKEDGTFDYTVFMNDIKPYINGDLNITDIEGPVNAYGNNEDLSPDYHSFNYPQELLDGIKFAGFNTIVTANNHAYDKAWDGLVQMRKNIAASGLDFVGTYTSKQEYDEYFIKDINGIKVGVVAWSSLDNGLGEIMGEHVSYTMRKFDEESMEDVPRMLEDVKNMRKKGAEVILMPVHWGEEYQDEPSEMQRNIAKALIDGGVDILIGDHPHCVQPIEVYKVNRNGQEQDAICIYSLGNFFADQIGLGEPKTQFGMVVKADIIRDINGIVTIQNTNYMPTICYLDETKGQFGNYMGYSLLPAGKYAKMESFQENINSTVLEQAKYAWEHVCQVVGNQVNAYDGN